MKTKLKEFASRIKVNGRTKIKTETELLKSLKTQGFDLERKLIMSALRREKNALNKYNKLVINLQDYPEHPLKGVGYERDEYVAITLDVPKNHRCEVSHRRAKGYFSWTEAVSPESAKILEAYNEAVLKAWTDFEEYKTAEEKEVIKADEKIKVAEKQALDEWKKKYGVAKSGDSYEIANTWFNANKKKVNAFLKNSKRTIGAMSCKDSKRAAWAICQDTRFDTIGININSLSHVIR